MTESDKNFVDEYIRHSSKKVSGSVKTWIDTFLELVSKDKPIFEIGSGTGRDADYMERRGYNVMRTDIERGFIDFQKEQGKRVEKFDVKKDVFPQGCGSVFANAVFLHLTTDEFKKAVDGIQKFLPKGGVLAFSLKTKKKGDVKYDKNNHRIYFQYWDPKDVGNILEQESFFLEYINVSSDQWAYFIFRGK